MIHKTELHERDAVENVLKFNDLLLSVSCECHSQAIKVITSILCNVYFNNAQKHANNQLVQRVVEQLKQTERKWGRTSSH